jgi:hypothetical protein
MRRRSIVHMSIACRAQSAMPPGRPRSFSAAVSHFGRHDSRLAQSAQDHFIRPLGAPVFDPALQRPQLRVAGIGWQGGHIHQFLFGEDSYERKDPPFEPDFPEVLDENGVSLRQELGGLKTFVYLYDYGDNRRHKVKIEKVVAVDAPIARAVCIGGKNACPPEGVGGPPGYEEFLEVLADPGNSEHEHLKAWIGGSFDLKAFDVAEVNDRLSPSE